MNLLDTKPDYETDIAKWWKDDLITDWLHEKDQNDISLDDYYGYVVLIKSNNELTRVVVYNREVVMEDKSIEGIGFKIDTLKLQIAYGVKNEFNK